MTRSTRLVHASSAAVLVLLVNLLTAVLSHRYPFGDYTRNIDDMWDQFIPQHLHLRQLLVGGSSSDWTFSWAVGAGSSFVPDYTTYLASPFAPLVALFPASQIETTLWLIVSLKMATAAAAAVIFLSAVKPTGNAWLLSLLGASYGLCAWAMDDATYVPMWLDGLVALPAISLVGFWALKRRRFFLGILVIAVSWWANYYTAYMASLGAATVLLSLVIIRRQRLGVAAVTFARFLAQGALGVALTAVLLVPTILAVRGAAPGVGAPLNRMPWSAIPERMLSGSEGVGLSASLWVGMLALTLALGLPWLRSVPLRTRVTALTGAALVMLSLQFHPTFLIWHAFSSPNGSQYRQAFVVCFWLVLLAWLAVGPGWSRPVAVVAAGSLAAVGALAGLGADPYLSRWSWIALALAVGSAGVVAGLGPRLAAPGGRWLRGGALVAASIMVVVDGTATYLIVQQGQDEFFGKRAPSISADWLARQVRPQQSGWPVQRAEAMTPVTGNPGAFFGYEGVPYYSSLVPASMAEATQSLGFPHNRFGRSFYLPADDAARQIMSVGLMLGSANPERLPTFPMVRSQSTVPVVGPDVWASRASFYERPVMRAPAAQVDLGSGFIPLTTIADAGESGRLIVQVDCRPGEVAQVYLDGLVPRWFEDLVTGESKDTWAGGVVQLGRDGPAEFAITARWGPTSLTAEDVRCFDRSAAQADIAARDVPEIEIQGSRIRAQFAEPVHGAIVMATFAQPGWACSIDGRSAPIASSVGLLAVAADGAKSVECRFEPPGLRAGALASGLAALVVSAAAAWVAVRRRRPVAGRSAEGGRA